MLSFDIPLVFYGSEVLKFTIYWIGHSMEAEKEYYCPQLS